MLAAELALPQIYARFDGIVSSFLGETATNLRRVFSYAAKAPSLLFFDEFDTIKAMVLAGAKELPGDLLRSELEEQRGRLRAAGTVIASE